MTLSEIEKEIAALPSAEKELLLAHLLAELDGSEEDGVHDLWLAEARQRYRMLQEGTVEAIPSEEVITRVKERLEGESKIPS